MNTPQQDRAASPGPGPAAEPAAALVLAQERYRAFIQNSSEAIWCCELARPVDVSLPEDEQIDLFYRDGVMSECNLAMARMYGYGSTAELVGIRLEAIMPRSDARNVAYLREFIRSGYSLTDAESVERARDGSVKHILNNLVGTLEGGLLLRAWGTSRDITEQRRTEASLRAAEAQLRVVIDAMPALIAYIDAGHRYLFNNRAYQDWFGVDLARVSGRHMREVLGEGAYERLRPHVERALRGERVHFEQMVPYRGGARYVSVSYIPDAEPASGRVLGLYTLVTDLTARKRSEEATRFVADASAALAGSLDYQATLAAVARMAVPRFADWCAVDVLDERGSLLRLATAHADVDMVALAEEVHRRFPTPPDSPSGPYAVLRSGEAELVAEITDEALVRGARGPEHLAMLRGLGLRSYMCVPLAARGNIAGTLTFVSAESGRVYTPDDLALAVDLGRRAAVAIDNARLYRAQQESESQYRTLVEQVRDYAIFRTDPQGRAATWNAGVERVLGYSEEEFIGLPAARLFTPEAVAAGVVEAELGEAARTGSASDDRWMMRKDGTRFYATGVTSGLYDEHGRLMGFTKVMRDQTADRRAQEALLASEQRKAAMLESALDCIITMDQEGRIVEFNPAAERTFGYQRAEVVGRAVAGTLVPLAPGAAGGGGLEDLLRADGAPAIGRRVEMTAMRAGGERFPAELAISPTTLPDGTLIFTAYLRDITERKRSEQELRRHAELLARSVADLEDFAHITAHDLKEPLRGMRLTIGFLLEDARDRLPPDDVARLGTLDALAGRMTDLLEATLRYSRVGHEPMRPGRCELGVLATEAAEGLRARLGEAGAAVRVQPGMPSVECDAALIRQVFANLISNAVRYNDSARKFVEVGAREGPQGPVVYVRDNGIGIPTEHQSDIFGMFKRLHGRDRYGSGTGAGLAIVKRAVERHGGRIWVESSPGMGSTFYFTLGGPGGEGIGRV